MSKELTPLQAFNNLCGHLDYDTTDYMFNGGYEEDAKIIETALKENEKLKKCFKNELKNTAYYNNLALKYKKALEIIKEKRADIYYFMNCKTLEEYNDDVLAGYAYEEDAAEQRMLTQEEYDLLKEILK